MPLTPFQAGGLTVAYYERLCTDPGAELGRLFATLGASYRASVFEELREPSMTTRAGSALHAGGDALGSLSSELSARQIRNVLDVVELFGLSHLHGESTMPASRSGTG